MLELLTMCIANKLLGCLVGCHKCKGKLCTTVEQICEQQRQPLFFYEVQSSYVWKRLSLGLIDIINGIYVY